MAPRLSFVCPKCGTTYAIIRSTGPRQHCPSCGHEPSMQDLLSNNDLQLVTRSRFGMLAIGFIVVALILIGIAAYVGLK